jgi:hypothetical protein
VVDELVVVELVDVESDVLVVWVVDVLLLVVVEDVLVEVEVEVV